MASSRAGTSSAVIVRRSGALADGGVDLLPPHRRRHGREVRRPQRVGRDDRPRGVVGEPVDQHPATAQRDRCAVDDAVGVSRREPGGELARERLGLPVAVRRVERDDDVQAHRSGRLDEPLQSSGTSSSRAPSPACSWRRSPCPPRCSRFTPLARGGGVHGQSDPTLAAVPAGARDAMSDAARQGFVSGLSAVLITTAASALAGALLALWLVREREIEREPVVVCEPAQGA
jgi:hypothetical protein